jgi:hypothetical protein
MHRDIHSLIYMYPCTTDRNAIHDLGRQLTAPWQ